ncbi:MAG TPA: cytochrome P450 [Acidimicrobiales bacterium]|nr:cytochrome P450 [Acidimicrobiales bacterium]
MVEYDPFSVAAMSDPFPLYRALRALGPVYRLERYDAWALPRFEEVWQVAQDRDNFSIVEGPVFGREKLLRHNDGAPDTAARRPVPSFAAVDPPLHTQLRQRMYPSFTPRACRDLAAEVEEMVQQQLDALEDRERFDVVADFASPVAVVSTLRFLGLPLSDADTLRRLINASTTRDPGTPGQSSTGLAAHLELRSYLTVAVAQRRGAGVRDGDGVIERLLEFTNSDGLPFTDDEIAVQISTLLVGGGETLPKIIAGGLLQLDAHRDQRDALVDDPGLVPQAFEEMVRLEGVLQFVGRTLTRDAVVGGQQMRSGQRVLLLLQSANRDGREFSDPDTFSIHRIIPRQVGFGHGVHFCIGAHAARLVGIALLRGFLRRYPHHLPDRTAATRPPSEFQIGWTTLPVDVRS